MVYWMKEHHSDGNHDGTVVGKLEQMTFLQRLVPCLTTVTANEHVKLGRMTGQCQCDVAYVGANRYIFTKTV